MTKFLLAAWICLIFISLTPITVIGKENIALAEVSKLNLSERPGGVFSVLRRFEVINENGVWKSYQLKDSVTRIFIKVIPAEKLLDLLTIINAKDTSIRVEQFNMQYQEMVSAFDTMSYMSFFSAAELRPYQKTFFKEALRDEKRIEQALRSVLLPTLMDDRSEYTIAITTKAGEAKVITAYSFVNIYNLPWEIDGVKVYDPNISRLFALLTDDDRFESRYKGFLYRRLLLQIYWSEFRTSFAWANLKEAFPLAVNNLGNTLYLTHCFKDTFGWRAMFSSSLLPEQVSIGGVFKYPDAIFSELKQLEERLVNLRKQNNYLFRYLRNHSDFQASVEITANPVSDDIEMVVFANLKKNHRKLIPFRFEQVRFIWVKRRTGAPGEILKDMWILLPSDKWIVLPFIGPDESSNKAFVYSKKGNLLRTLTDLDVFRIAGTKLVWLS